MYRTNPFYDDNVELDQKNNTSFGFVRKKHLTPVEVEDAKELKDWFQNGSYIPYTGKRTESGHGVLFYNDQMFLASPTRNACINSKKSFLFGSKIEIYKSTSDTFSTGDVEAELAAPDIVQRFDEIFSPKPYVRDKPIRVMYGRDRNLKTLLCNVYEGFAKNGNGYIETALVETSGIRSAGMYSQKQKHCLYDVSKSYDPDYVAISNMWTQDYLRRNPPKLRSIYPLIENDGLGDRTMWHIKNGDNIWYGYPLDRASYLYWYREFQDPFYLTRVTNNDFTGRHILEFESGLRGNNVIDNLRGGGRETANRWGVNWSNRGEDPDTFIIMSRPHGTKPMAYFRIDPNTNEEFYKVNHEIAKDTIIMTNNWSRELLGDSGKPFSVDSISSHLKVKSVSSFLYEHDAIMREANTCVKVILDWLGETDLLDYSIRFVSPNKLLKNEEADVNING